MVDLKRRKLEKEFKFTAIRSSGPGGQNVNKVSTRVELRFNVKDSEFLDEDEKKVISERLKKRINLAGELILTCQTERSQLKNKEKVAEMFHNLLEKSLAKKTPRIPTRPTKGSKESRLDSKKKRSFLKTSRVKVRKSHVDD